MREDKDGQLGARGANRPEAAGEPNINLCGSGRAREEFNAEPGTGCAGVCGHPRSHRVRIALTKSVIFQRLHWVENEHSDYRSPVAETAKLFGNGLQTSAAQIRKGLR